VTAFALSKAFCDVGCSAAHFSHQEALPGAMTTSSCHFSPHTRRQLCEQPPARTSLHPERSGAQLRLPGPRASLAATELESGLD